MEEEQSFGEERIADDCSRWEGWAVATTEVR